MAVGAAAVDVRLLSVPHSVVAAGEAADLVAEAGRAVRAGSAHEPDGTRAAGATAVDVALIAVPHPVAAARRPAPIGRAAGAAAARAGDAVQVVVADGADGTRGAGGAAAVDVAFIGVLDAVLACWLLAAAQVTDVVDAVARADLALPVVLTLAVRPAAAARDPAGIGVMIGRRWWIAAEIGQGDALANVAEQRAAYLCRLEVWPA